MLFNSYIFIMLFLPLCITGYFALNHAKWYNGAMVYLLGMSLWFYGYFNPSYLTIIVASIVFNYGMAVLLGKTEKAHWRKVELIAALLVNFGILFHFKYSNFFVQNLNRVFSADLALREIILPLGISFFTFQQASYIIDTYRRETKSYSFLQYACFVSYFPQLIAGPIVTHDELIPQFQDISKKQFNWDNLVRGIYIFTLGLSKKVLIADTFGKAADWGFSNISALNTTNAIFVMLAYTFQIYFDFSGYCDMSVGLGKMMNIDLPVNFNSPYKALSVTEFWKRWHMTLTRFFTKYVYIPMGGNRRGRARTYVNILFVFLLSGLWHGAGWHFIIWGGLHGLMQIVERHWKDKVETLHPALHWMGTFAFLNVSWVVFRADGLKDAWSLIKQVLLLDFVPLSGNITSAFALPELAEPYYWLCDRYLPSTALAVAALLGALILVLGCKNAHEKMDTMKLTRTAMLITSLLLVWCIFSFSGISIFLYFNF